MAKPYPLLVMLTLVPVVSSCQKDSSPAVALDNWWTVDFARNSCRAANSCGVDKDNPGGVQEYINSLKAQFALSSTCRGVDVFDYRGPQYKNEPEPDYKENLLIDYVPGNATQSFSIMGKPSNNIYGKGTLPEIVDRSCAAARGLGARVH